MKNIPCSFSAVYFLGALTALSLLTGCGERDSASHGHSHADGEAHDHAAEAGTPHGGTPVMVGEGKFHLEIVPDPSAEKMQAYVLDGHLEGYVPVPETNFVIEVKAAGPAKALEFVRVPEPGNMAAKSALFEAKAEWLGTVKEFEGTIPTITLNGSTFTNVSFPFPKGTKHVH